MTHAIDEWIIKEPAIERKEEFSKSQYYQHCRNSNESNNKQYNSDV